MTALALKWIAIITMTIDHVGMVFFPDIIAYRLVGRAAFPIFAFLVAEGYGHTRSVKGYLGRLGAFAIISELPYNLANGGSLFHPGGQNIFFTLALGVLACWVYDRLEDTAWRILPPVLLCISAQLLATDYGWYGVAVIFGFYLAGQNRLQAAFSLLVLTICLELPGIWMVLQHPRLVFYLPQIWCVSALLPIAFYNGRRGGGGKYFFYWYYPAHLLCLSLLSMVI